MYFLTELDPHLVIKSSRDPLGVQPIWQALGRQLVAHLTTSTTSHREFNLLLLGLYLAECALDKGGATDHHTREQERLACFLRFEQLAAYSRYAACESDGIRGITRVKRRLNEEHGVVTIGAADRHQILAEQRSYGVWGLYMSAARGSGLVEDGDARLTQSAREYVERELLPALGSTGAELERRVRRDGDRFEPAGRDRKLASALGKLLEQSQPQKLSVMRDALLEPANDNDRTNGRQKLLWQAMRSRGRAKRFDWSARCNHADVVALRDAAPPDLASALDAVLAVEPLLAPCEELFDHIVGLRAVKRSVLLAGLNKAWGKSAFGHLRVDAVEAIGSATDDETRGRFGIVLEALRRDDFDVAVNGLLEQNDAVMRSRGGAGWLDHRGAELRSRFFQRPSDLPDRGSLPTLWRNSYFLDALRWVGAGLDALAGPAHGD